MPDKGDTDEQPRADWPDLPQADPDFASGDPPPPPAVPGPAGPDGVSSPESEVWS